MKWAAKMKSQNENEYANGADAHSNETGSEIRTMSFHKWHTKKPKANEAQ